MKSLTIALLSVATMMATAAPGSATTFKLVYNGFFNEKDALNPEGSALTPFSDLAPVPFTATAIFNDTSPNLVPAIPGWEGFVAYSPERVTLTVEGQTYKVTTYDEDSTRGVTVAIFDQNTPFVPGHYGIGLLQNPSADGAGFIGDWLSAEPNFLATNLVPTVFTEYEGVGFGSGPRDEANNPTVVPIPLINATTGTPYLLTLGNYEEMLATGGILNRARLELVEPIPEPLTILGTGIALGWGIVFKRKRV